MLQQTRAQAVIPYYERFLARFPTVQTLAATAEQDVLAAWAGLGYYSRARNLRRAAERIADKGGFPEDYDAIRALPGIGDYTAAAVASIAFQKPYAAVDGNVLRVIARVQNDASDIGAAATRRRFQETANVLLDRGRPGAFNQAMMELGATICLPRQPQCLICPVRRHCAAFNSGTASQLPIKLRKQQPVHLSETVVVVQHAGKVLLTQRDTKARRMADFWDLPSPGDAALKVGPEIGQFRHTITHHHYIFSVRCGHLLKISPAQRWFAPDEFCNIPLSTTAKKALRIAGLVQKL